MIHIRRTTAPARDEMGVEWYVLAAGMALALLDLFLLRGWTGSPWPLVADVAVLLVVSGALGLGLRLGGWLLQPIPRGAPSGASWARRWPCP